jgi:sterol-4alpha-carboxylate 3-dehydrogenase (decarboxylating)
VDESYPLADSDPSAPAYARSKALAETAVLKANSPPPFDLQDKSDWAGYLRTAALRFPIVYGTHDLTSIPGCLGALKKGQTDVQIGDGKNLWDFCSTENAAIAHSLVVQALLGRLDCPGNIDGEAFHIHDGDPRPFLDFARTVWKSAGHSPKSKSSPKSIPTWFALTVATVLEWLFWTFTMGTKRPQTLGKQQVEYACFTHTYNITKAKERLGYSPKQNFDAEIERAVKWSLENDGWAEKLKRR